MSIHLSFSPKDCLHVAGTSLIEMSKLETNNYDIINILVCYLFIKYILFSE